MNHCVPSCLIFLMAALSLAVCASEPKPPAAIMGFLSTYCYGCHDGDTHKAGLELDSLQFNLAESQNESRWVGIFDRVSAGKMPPKNADQPPVTERDSWTRNLGMALKEFSLARQNTEGRVQLRRLNRTEFENTLRDLLALPALQVKNLLPEESPSAGFDNVSAAQSISSVHLVRYQQALDKALAAAVPTRTFKPIHLNVSGREIMGSGNQRKGYETWKCWLKGNALVIPSTLWRPYTTIATPPAPVEGRYRIRVTGYGLNTGGVALPLAFNFMYSAQLSYGEDLAWRDLPADKSGTAQVELDLQPGQVIDVMGWTLPHRDAVKGKLKDQPSESWTGPSLALEKLEVDGPLDTWPPESYKRLFGDLPLRTLSEIQAEREHKLSVKPRENRNDDEWHKDPLMAISTSPKQDAERLIRSFLPRAFRRPVSEELQRHYVSEAFSLLDQGLPFHEAMIESFKSVMCSPYFLFLQEHPGQLDDYALASRLSYFLWNSLPDDELLVCASKGELATPAVMLAQLERMLHDSRANRFTENFTGQWLDLRKIDATSPDMNLYPEFDHILQSSSVRETELFFQEILDHNLSVLEFVQSDWTFLNRRLAQHYGIPAEKDLGYELRKMLLPASSHRGGVMTQASVLKVTADGARTSPILRGKWICERILGVTPPPPPSDVAKIEPDIRGATTIRQQLAKHRSSAACASCHTVIDPPGFALETYDVIGGWRDFYRVPKNTGKTAHLINYNRTVNRGLDVEKGDKMPDGRSFSDIEEYKHLLLEDKDALARNLVRKIITYATGADIQFADREIVDEIVKRLHNQNYGFRTLIHEVTQSRCFLRK